MSRSAPSSSRQRVATPGEVERDRPHTRLTERVDERLDPGGVRVGDDELVDLGAAGEVLREAASHRAGTTEDDDSHPPASIARGRSPTGPGSSRVDLVRTGWYGRAFAG